MFKKDEGKNMNKFKIENYKNDEVDMAIIKSTQNGLEICERPYLELANALNVTEEEICERLERMYQINFVRKNAVATNHYKLGFIYNAMTVWELEEDHIDIVGEIFRELGFVSHCYQRPKLPPHWNYNLFAMVHGRNETEMNLQIEKMKTAANGYILSMDKIISSEILKKTGIRLKDI
jgi:DNA-binding Lrp family transcriptional regulator